MSIFASRAMRQAACSGRNPKGQADLGGWRCWSLLVWSDQTASLAPSPPSQISSVAHARIYEIGSRMSNDTVWLAVGFLGQAMFSMRFVVQWLYSERKKKSVIPLAFWYFSVAGGATLLAYAIHKVDPVFIVGQAGGLFVYLRNLQLLRQHRAEAAPE
jgi:lipid-A-disaccharide synthase-like uncharacterized protein